jgi:serine/threonine protein phosphatase 1
MRTLAIGDIHGCHTALTTLLKSLELRPDDKLIFLGDYIDRGPASRQVIETLLELKKSFSPVFLRGNHEMMMLEARDDSLKSNLWRTYGGLEALESYGVGFSKRWVSAIPKEHWNFVENTQRFFETDTHIFVHACLDPDLDMDDQPDWLLYWEFLDRLKPHKSGKQIICGHTPQRSGRIKNLDFALCIDTAPVSGGWLTALDVSAGNYWQANERGQTRRGALETD